MPQRLTLLWGKRTNMAADAAVGAPGVDADDACDAVVMLVMLLVGAGVVWRCL